MRGKNLIDTSKLPENVKKLLQKKSKITEKHKLITDNKVIIRIYQRYYHPKFGYLYELLDKKILKED